MILAALVMVYMQTRFRSVWRSAGLLGILLLVPGILRNNISWWHPDALAILAAVLTLFFLDLDHLRLGRFFFAAAVCCGLASAIKLLGFFFVFALAGYVLLAWIVKKEKFGRLLLKSGGFVAVMALVILISNPFLLFQSQREKLIRIQTDKSAELANGYTHDNPLYYQKGPQWWRPTLEQWYGSIPFLIFSGWLSGSGVLLGKGQGSQPLDPGLDHPLFHIPFLFCSGKAGPLLAAGDGAVIFRIAEFGHQLQTPLGFYGTSGIVLIVLAWQVSNYLGYDFGLYTRALYREIAAGY